MPMPSELERVTQERDYARAERNESRHEHLVTQARVIALEKALRDMQQAIVLCLPVSWPCTCEGCRSIREAILKVDGHGEPCYPHYTSSYCIDGVHEQCRKTCKNCGQPCLCKCHVVLA